MHELPRRGVLGNPPSPGPIGPGPTGPGRTPLHRTGYERYSPRIREGGCSRKHSPLLFAHYQYRAVSVTDNRIGNASHEGPFYPTVATAPHYYQPGAYLVS